MAQLARAASLPLVPGGRYEVLECIGAGGMGTVYRARDAQLDRDVALKVVNDARHPAAAAELVLRLGREARTVASLEHACIPPVHEIGALADGRAYYVMKLVQGSVLGAPGPTPRNAAPRVFLRLCEAVAYAHGKGVVHRDLKPENVMLGPLGELHLMDWGLAAALHEGAPAAAAAGTPGFMAPEQEVPGLPVDARTDVFALGGILAFLATGRGPGRDGALELGGVPRPLAAVIARARRRAPGERYPSALELARDVAAFLDREPVGAYREGPFERAGRFLAKHQFVAWLVVGYLTLRAAMLFFIER